MPLNFQYYSKKPGLLPAPVIPTSKFYQPVKALPPPPPAPKVVYGYYRGRSMRGAPENGIITEKYLIIGAAIALALWLGWVTDPPKR